MVNARCGNTFYIDTAYSASTDELAVKNLKLTYLVVAAIGGAATIVLSDGVYPKLKIVVPSGQTQNFDFSRKPILFQNSIRPSTLTTCIATAVIEETRS